MPGTYTELAIQLREIVHKSHDTFCEEEFSHLQAFVESLYQEHAKPYYNTRFWMFVFILIFTMVSAIIMNYSMDLERGHTFPLIYKQIKDVLESYSGEAIRESEAPQVSN